MSVETLLSRLDGVRENRRGRWMARCPAHDDRSPSLSIKEADDRTLIFCHAGCEPLDILAAVGLSFSDLFRDGPIAHHVKGQKRQRLPARQVLDAVSEALTTLTLADSALMRGEPLTGDDYDAMDRALAVLAEARQEVA